MFNTKKIQYALPWLIILCGIIVRLREFIANRSLFVDEAFLARNITERSYMQLLQPLTDNQHAPIGFLWLERLFVQLFGNTDIVLRVVPLLAGIFSIIIFYKLTRQIVNKAVGTIALAFFTFSDLLIHYSTELKQYSVEVFVVLCLYLLYFSKKTSRSYFFHLLIVGGVALLFSHGAIFVLISIASFDIVKAIRAKHGQLLLSHFARLICWLLVFFFLYLIDLSEAYANSAFLAEWPYVYLFPHSVFEVMRNITGFKGIFFELLGPVSAWMGMITFIVGVYVWMRRDRSTFYVFTGPFILALIASGLHKYPFVVRVFLFATPMIILAVTYGVIAIYQKMLSAKSYYARIAGVIFIILLTFGSFFLVANRFIHPRTVEEVKPLLSYYQKHHQRGDSIYVYYASEAAFKYYAPKYGITPDSFVIGPMSRDNWEVYTKDIDKEIAKKRVWFLFSHVLTVTNIPDNTNISEEEYISNHLNTIGKQIHVERRTGAALYLYYVR